MLSPKTAADERHADEETRPHGLVVGAIMPCHALTRDGVLLLRRGERIVSIAQLKRLFDSDVLFSTENPEALAKAAEEEQRRRELFHFGSGGLRDIQDRLRCLSVDAPEKP